MSESSSYLVPTGELVIEQDIKKSRFIASVSYAGDKETALDFIKKISTQHQVTRYFGGTKLGTGGLVRAYAGTITMALDKLKLKERVNLVEININVGYEFENAVRTLLDMQGLKIKDVQYTEDVRVTADIPESISKEIESEVLNATRGKAVIKILQNL